MKDLKATQLTRSEINKIIMAIEMRYDNEDGYDEKMLELASRLGKATLIIAEKTK